MRHDAQKEAARLLKEHGAVLLRTKKHNVYRLANGKTVVVSQSPHDKQFAYKKILRDIQRAIGL